MFMKSECILLKLVSGETVVAKYVEEDADGVTITDALSINLEQTFSDAGVRNEMVPRFLVQGHEFMGVGGKIRHDHIMLRFLGTTIHDNVFKRFDEMVTHAHKLRSGIEIVKPIVK
jgi:hypothetical protein